MAGNATFLTECSFGVAHDKLVQVITDVQPFEPHWEDLSSIDLSKKALDSVARLKEFLPKLDTLTVCVCCVIYGTWGLTWDGQKLQPAVVVERNAGVLADTFCCIECVRAVCAASDVGLNDPSLTGVTSFGHLLNLEHLDISRNDIDSLTRR